MTNGATDQPGVVSQQQPGLHKKLGVYGAAAAVHAHRDAHFYCGTRVDFGPIRERLKASRGT